MSIMQVGQEEFEDMMYKAMEMGAGWLKKKVRQDQGWGRDQDWGRYGPAGKSGRCWKHKLGCIRQLELGGRKGHVRL